MKYAIIALAALFVSNLSAQQFTQTIRGRVTESETRQPVGGAKLELISLAETSPVFTDSLGNFEFTAVQVGRHMLSISAEGYSPTTISDIILNSAKEVVLNIELTAKVVSIAEARIKAGKNDPAKTNNDLVTVSGRQFTIDQSNRYAGSLGDPSRMASNFAGVSGMGSQRNDIIIRGNSPMGLLWRLDGADIPNPNHFASQGATGGPVSILNNNTLSNSDFLTGAFPAEYGNANSGVFDLRMRNGNNKKHEYVGQVGFNGFELGAEGPLAQKKGSFLVNYRYSTMALMSKMGLNLGYGGVPYYQDISMKLHLPTAKSGEWGITAIGGTSSITILDKNRDTSDMSYGTSYRNNIFNGSNVGVLIVSNILKIGNKGYWKNIAYATMQTRFTGVDSVNQNSEVTHWKYGENATTRRVGIHSLINYKWNSRISSRSGVMVSYLHSDLRDSFRNGETVRTLREFKGGNVLSQAYTQLKWQLGKGMVLVPGVYSQYWAENNAVSIEPRLGYKWNLGKKLSISSGAGFHSQMQPMEIYYTKIWDTTLNKYRLPNTQLGFSNAKHIAAGIEFLPGSSMRFRVESYFQQLGKIPVSVDASSNLSLSNWGADFGGLPSFDSLVNEGKGRNYGIEITLERFFSKGFYWLFTTSIFDSKYAMQDGVYKNSAWNGGWVINALAGYDWVLGKNKNNVITFNAKVNSAGGRRYTPVDVAATETDGNLVRYDWKNPFSQKFEDYFRVDFRIGFKRNGKKITQEWAVDLQNLTNHQNALSKSWDFNRKQVVTDYQQGFFPMVTYRILF